MFLVSKFLQLNAESPVFLAMTMSFFAGLYVAEHSSSYYRAASAIIIIRSITLSLQLMVSLSLSLSLAPGQAQGPGGWESFPLDCLF